MPWGLEEEWDVMGESHEVIKVIVMARGGHEAPKKTRSQERRVAGYNDLEIFKSVHMHAAKHGFST